MRVVSVVTAIVLVLLTVRDSFAQDPASNIVLDPGFETNPIGNGWVVQPEAHGHGIALISILGIHSGRGSLRLMPNSTNPSGFGQSSFGLTQVLDVQKYLGQTLYFSGWLKAEKGATAVLRLAAVDESGAAFFRELRQTIEESKPVFRRDLLDIPNRTTMNLLIVSCTVEGTTGSAFFDDLMVSADTPSDWPAATGAVDAGSNLQASVIVNASNKTRDIPRTIYGSNLEWVFNANGLWDPKTNDFDPTAFSLARDLGSSLYRFPSGFFADFYHWKNGIGDPSTRPPGRMLAPGSLSSSGFGTDEALRFADTTNGDLMIGVNITTGTPEEAADWVRYVNGKRYVRYWEIGNEPYVDLGQVDPDIPPYTPDSYAERFLTFAAAMKEADPTIKVGAAMDFNYGVTTYHPYPTWTQDVIRLAGPSMDFVSVHNGFSPVLPHGPEWNLRSIYSTMLASPVEQKDVLQRLGQLIEDMLGKDSPVGICVSEWGPLFDDNPDSPYIDHTKTLGSAIYVASFYKVLLESSKVFAANAFKLNDGGLFAGWIGVRDGKAVPKAPYYSLQLFTQHFGPELVESQTTSPTYDNRSLGWVDSAPAVPYLETVASRSSDGSSLYIIAINKHFDRSIDTSFSLKGFCPDGNDAGVWTLNGTALDANSGTPLVDVPPIVWATQAEVVPDGRFNSGGPDEVGISSSTTPVGSTFKQSFPPHSVTAIQITGTLCN
jgi:alpha-N-arabinofuranosidase